MKVGDEVRDAFPDLADTAFAPTRPGHWTCDLYTVAHRRLLALGVERVYGGGSDPSRTRASIRTAAMVCTAGGWRI